MLEYLMRPTILLHLSSSEKKHKSAGKADQTGQTELLSPYDGPGKYLSGLPGWASSILSLP